MSHSQSPDAMNLTTFGKGVNHSNVPLLEKNPSWAIPYITVLCICCVTGTFGNTLVIVSILTVKVKWLQFKTSLSKMLVTFGCWKAVFNNIVLSSDSYIKKLGIRLADGRTSSRFSGFIVMHVVLFIMQWKYSHCTGNT